MQKHEHLAANIARRFISDFSLKRDWSIVDIHDRAKALGLPEDERADLVIAGKSFLEWQKIRQVYRFEKSLVKELQDAPMDFAIEDLHVPFSSLYFDLKGCDIILDSLPVQGIYATFVKDFEHRLFFVALIGPDPEMRIVKGALVLGKRLSIEEHIKASCGNLNGDAGLTRLLLSMLSYISSEEADLCDKGKTRFVYRDHDRKGVSEVREWDVGFRIMREKEKEPHNSIPSPPEPQSSHASPRAHIRKGHWHTYWCGTGRKERKIKWVRETKVGKGEITTVIRETES